jgi:PleD family two-component response regulator
VHDPAGHITGAVAIARGIPAQAPARSRAPQPAGAQPAGAQPAGAHAAGAQVIGTPPAGTILIADDEPDVLRTTARILRRNGYITLEAATGFQALEILAANDVQLLLTDSLVPGMTGAALADRARQIRPGLGGRRRPGREDRGGQGRAGREERARAADRYAA